MSSPTEEEQQPSFKPIRLQRFLAQCGLGSRRDCEELITAGRVTVDGEVVAKLGTSVDPSGQTVALDGERLKVERKKYFMLNKPSGFLCTASDPGGRRVVLDLFPNEGPRLFTVGRLDENTTGLLVVTNDGDLSQKLAHPSYRIFRLYRAQVAGQPRPEIFEQLKQGLFFTEGKFRVHGVKPVKKQKDSTWVEITMTEGQNREIRRLFARVGHKIMKLERIGYGPLRLGRLPRGEYRDLTREELAELHAVLQRNQSEGTSAPDAATPARRSSAGGERRSTRPGGGRGVTGGTNRRVSRAGGEGRGRAGEERRSRASGGSRPGSARGPAGGRDRRSTGGKSHSERRPPGANEAAGDAQGGGRKPRASGAAEGRGGGRKPRDGERTFQRGPAKKKPQNRRGRGRR